MAYHTRHTTVFLAAFALVLWASQASAITEFWEAFDTRFLTLHGGTTGVPQGDYIAIGLVTNTAYTASLTNVSPSAVASSMILWDSGAVGVATDIDGAFLVMSVKSGAGFFGQRIYLLAVNAPTVAAATQVGVFTNPSWVFPANDTGTGAIELSDAGTTALIGALTAGTITTPPDIAGLDAAALGSSVAVTEPVTNTWNGGTGSWSNASNWSLNVVPDNNDGSGTNYVARIDGGNAATSAVVIDLFLSFTVDRVVLDSNDRLTITNGASLTMTDGATFNGMVALVSAGNSTYLHFNGAQTLGGTGQVLLAGTTSSLDQLDGSGTLTVGTGITIHGAAGTISGDCANPLVNQGTISADTSNQTLNVSCFVNQGQLIATNGATLSLNGFTNNGVISVSGGTLSLNGAYTTAAMGTISNSINSVIVLNGTLSGCGAVTGNIVVQGSVQANCGSALNFSGGTVTNNGTITASNGTVVNFFGPVVNNGLVDNTSGNVHFFSTLGGSGTVLAPPTNSWIAGVGKWETATNWSSGQAPSLADSADLITNAGNKTVTIDAATAGGFPNSLTISNLTVGAPLNSTNTLLLSNAGTNTPLAVRNSVRVNNGGSIFITNSALLVNGPSGGAVTVDGQLTMDSGTILVSSNLLVGPSNPLSLVTIWGGALYVTNGAHSAVTEVRYGTLELTGGVYFTDRLLITNTGASFINDGGTFTITGLAQVDQGTQTVASGTTQLSSNLVVGSSANSTGTVNVTGGQLIVTNAPITIGNLGVGSMTVSNGTVSTTGVAIGAGTNSQGTLTLQDGSTMTVSSNLTAGSASGATGTVNVTGGQLVVTNGTLGIGNAGTVNSGSGVGSMTVSDGATVTASTILLGSSAGGEGHLTLDAGGVIRSAGSNAVLVVNGFGQIGGDLGWTNIGSTFYCGYAHPGAYALSNGNSSCQDVYVGYDNAGTMTIDGGTMNILSRLIVGQLGNPVSTGAVWITGGQVTIANYSIIGNSGVGQMNISNGIVTAADVFIGNSGNPGTLTLAGGTLTVTGIVVPNPNSWFNFSGGWLSAKAITNANGRVVTVGNGVNPATLSLLGGISSLDKGMTVSASTTLLGLGTISGSVVNFGFIFPVGGALTISGVVTNHGTIVPTAGSTINFNGQVVNDGLIFTNSATHFSAGLINSGTVVDANGDPDHDGFTNLQEYEAGTDPHDPNSTPFQITSIVQQGGDVLLTWTAAGGKTNVVQSTTGASGNYSNNFTDLSPIIVPSGSDLTVTNYLHVGAAANTPARYYRVRLVP